MEYTAETAPAEQAVVAKLEMHSALTREMREFDAHRQHFGPLAKQDIATGFYPVGPSSSLGGTSYGLVV